MTILVFATPARHNFFDGHARGGGLALVIFQTISLFVTCQRPNA
jgi:hypothetical protein